jgi:hypothetical protein
VAEHRYPLTRGLKQVPGVGTLTALTFVLTLGEPMRFAHNTPAPVTPTAGSSTSGRAVRTPIALFGQEIVGFKWVYTFNNRTVEKLIPENFNLEGETHGF